MRFMGIDPGKTGGVVILNEKKDIELMEVMQDTHWFRDLIENEMKPHKKDTIVFLEKAQSFPHQGVVSVATYMQAFGELIGVLVAFKVRFELVPPQTWSKVMHIGATAEKPKEKTRQVIKRIFPDVSFKLYGYPKTIKEHEGLMDAAILAEYGRMKWIKQ